MKKLGIVLSLLFILAGAFMYNYRAPAHGVLGTDANDEISKVSNTPIVDDPVPKKLIIPKIQVDAAVEQVGLDKESRMDVPRDDMNVGWYRLGVIPGQMGSAVIAGHFDTKKGTPAVFYKLSDLEKGDLVYIENSLGRKKYIVTETSIFKDESFPVNLVFGQNDARRLNLITCSGVFDQQSKNYNDRVVVFTELSEE